MSVPKLDLNAPLKVDTSTPEKENETVTKSLGWFYGGSALLIILVLISVGVGALASSKPKPIPIKQVEPTKPVEIKLDKNQWKFEVLNGSGKKGEAGRIAKQLEAQGYEVVETGNAAHSKFKGFTLTIQNAEQAQLLIDDLTKIGLVVTTQSGLPQNPKATAQLIVGSR